MAITKVTSGLISADASSIDLNIDAGTLYLDVSENRVGIGTTSPEKALHIRSTSNQLRLQDSTNDKKYDLNVDGNNFSIDDMSAGSSRFTIKDGGNVGIGDSSPENRLHVKGAANTSTTVQIESASTGYSPKILFDGIVGSLADNLLGEVGASWDTHTNKVAAIRFESGSDTTNKDDGLISFWTSDAGSTLDERMRIDSSGNVGIGVTSSYPLTVQSGTAGSNHAIALRNNSTNNLARLGFLQQDSATAAYTSIDGDGRSTGSLRFNTNDTERMRIDADGIMLLGTTTRAIGTAGNVNKFGVAGGSNSAFPMVVFADQDTSVEGGSVILELSFDSDISYTSANYVLFTDQTATQGSISGTGNQTVSFNTSSDRRLKENIVDTGSQLEKIKQIEVRDFNYIGNDITTTGMIAQELNEIIPNVVVEGQEDFKKHPWSIDYGKLTPYLIKAIQEQQEQIEELKKEIETFKN